MVTKAETHIVRAILEFITDSGGDGWHVHGSMLQRGGEPDIDGFIPSEVGYLHLKIEVKTPEGQPTVRQIARLRRYYEAGYVSGVVTSTDEFKRLIAAFTNYYFNGATLHPLGKTIHDYLSEQDVTDEYKIYE